METNGYDAPNSPDAQSAPNGDEVWVRRATRPSILSKIIEKNIAIPAASKLDDIDWIIA